MAIQFDQLCAQAINQGHASVLKDLQRGIEKEGLRTDNAAHIAQTSHPKCLGSALAHPHITTDYSEALLELITKPHGSTESALEELCNLHRWVYQCLDKELIWPGSMPCRLEGEKSIPIARYGDSNIGQMKHVYRHGLAWRYGRIMQSIAGIHYNFSLPQAWWDLLYQQSDQSLLKKDFISSAYIALIRNFRRYAWLLTWLFGASPAMDKSFFEGRPHHLEDLDEDTAYLPYATCLRMTDLGYKSEAQSSIYVCYNHLDNYIQSLRQAMNEEYPEYRDIGVKVDGQYRQLNTNLIQIENEFYSEIRPKRTPRNGLTPLEALEQEGIEYIEVRLLDINPYLPLGLDAAQTRFIDTFLLHCLLSPSPTIDEEECSHIEQNLYQVAQQGRKPGLEIQLNKQSVLLVDAAQQFLENMQGTATLLDTIKQQDAYSAALKEQQAKVADQDKLPSQRLLNQLKTRQQSYSDAMLEQAREHQSLLTQPLSPEMKSVLQEMASQSHQRQQTIETEDNISFDEFLERYFEQQAVPA